VIPGKEGKVLRLRNAKLNSTLKGMVFGQSPHEAAIYRWGNGGNTLLVGVYIQMSDLGLLSFYMGIEVHQGDSEITLQQTAYAKHVVELAGLTDCNPAL
jgi:hypothetical protein